ncbi:DUF3108 domain-containing protein [Chitinimonas sp. BJB300]|uniref:DUF3108 domain-containing protein n=1 Tax=Chitinimonas sp. BJB300 TaxID=1559339 RepID=UPI0013043D89|nr:DUF3108 domain-containing protein [Chitinimonas sp. BJB300]
MVSLLLHVLLATGDSAWRWWQAASEDDAFELKPTDRRLKSQSLEADTHAQSESLPNGIFSIQIGRPPQRAPKKASPKPVPIAPAIPAELVTVTQAPELPSTSTPDETGAEQSAPTPPAEPPASPTQRPLVDTTFPRSVDINYVAFGVIEAEHRWRAEGKRYEITTRIKLEGRELRSQGEIGRYGLRPLLFRDGKDGNSQPTSQAEFNWPNKTVRLGEPDKQQELPLEEGAQDMFSAAYQFALLGDKLPSFNMQILSGRHSYQVPFTLKGEIELQLSNQRITTLLLTGTHQQRRFEFYLAPAWNNLPVRIKMADGDKVIDLKANQVRIDGQLVLNKPERPTRDR